MLETNTLTTLYINYTSIHFFKLKFQKNENTPMLWGKNCHFYNTLIFSVLSPRNIFSLSLCRYWDRIYSPCIFNKIFSKLFLFIYFFGITDTVAGKAELCNWALSMIFFLFRAAPIAYGSSQAKGSNWNLYNSHSNAGSEPHLWPTPQLTAMPDLWPTERGQGSNPQPQGY